jgi:acyl-coenzyme A thioesterase PaaI-like protein
VPESWRSRITRWGFNWFPAYRGTGARIEYVASDWTEVRIRLPLSWRTRNYVGTIFGGSLYGAIDPIFMIMLIKILGKDYEVWDKAATIRFKKPGRSTLRATFRLDDVEIDQIKRDVAASGKTERTYTVELKDDEGNPCMSCDKLLTIRARPPREGGAICT